MQKTGKLELTWVGKYDDKVVEPRILMEDVDKSYGDPTSENMLIHGDNLIALQALQQDFAGRIRCIFIDPPYNTGAAFEHYDDNIEHSTWLSLMKSRLILLRELLSDNGTIFIQIDDNEQAYLKVLCDEIFGRQNYVNMVSINAKVSAGASGGGEDKRLKKNIEYILIYSKDINRFIPFHPVYKKTETSVYKGYKRDKIEMRGDRAEMSDFPLYLNTVAGGLDRRDQTIGGFSFVVKIYAVPVVEIIG